MIFSMRKPIDAAVFAHLKLDRDKHYCKGRKLDLPYNIVCW